MFQLKLFSMDLRSDFPQQRLDFVKAEWCRISWHYLALVSMQTVLRHRCLRTWKMTVGHSEEKSLRDGEYGRRREVKRLSAIASEQLTPGALTGSARGEACGQALAGSLCPRGTATAPTWDLKIIRGRETERKRGACCSEPHRHLGVSQYGSCFVIKALSLSQCVDRGR